MNKFAKIKQFIINTPWLFKIVIYILNIKNTGTIFISPLSQEGKADLLLEYAKQSGCKIFVETGTYKGDTVDRCKDFFEELFSIELSHELFMACQERFVRSEKIHLYEGDSGSVLPKIIASKNDSILFWLDAHFSGGETARGELDSPVVKELEYILDNVTNFCILIDDARYFNGKNGYPAISLLKKIINGKGLKMQVKNDIIRISAE